MLSQAIICVLSFYLHRNGFAGSRFPVRAIRPESIFTREKAVALAAQQRCEIAMRGGVCLAEEGLQEAGRRIGRNYRIIKRLGHGGDGTIYLVRHEPTEQLRAAKLLKADVPGRRRHELSMMKRLRHPALPQVYDVLEEQGDLWIIMEFIRGRTLSELRGQERIGTTRFFSIARQLAEALVYLHTRKPPVLHLDIKPSNVMIRPDGSVVLIDFGAAVRADTKEGTSSCFGTPGFAAPEQWKPDAEPDARADFYGFGAVLYYCLYGSVPGKQDGIQKKNRKFGDRTRGCEHRKQDMEPVWRRREEVSLIRRCMQEDREKRFSDTLTLYHSVLRAEKRYLTRKKLCRSSAAILFLLAATAFASVNLRGNDSAAAMEAQTQRDYDALLEQADGLGFEQAVSCYEQAIGLCPKDGAWCEKLLERIGADYVFSPEEEAALKKLMFSVPPEMDATEEELLEDQAAVYGELAYRIGIMYWYFYEEAGGRSAAANWFGRALAWQEKQEKSAAWLESARIHRKIGGYYETLGKQNPEGGEAVKPKVYWEDLERLWRLDSLRREAVRVQCEVMQELLSVLIMQASELKKEGVSIEQMEKTMLSVEQFLSGTPEAEQVVGTCWEQYRAAWETLERLTENERGNEFGKKEKEQG